MGALRYLIGAGPVRTAAQAVVIAHDAFDHPQAVRPAMEAKKLDQLLPAGKKTVQVIGGHAGHPPVEHGIDIIRAALKGRYPVLFL